MKAGEEAKAELERSTGRTGVIELWHLDLASFDSVKRFAEKLEQKVDRIDGFIANAGIYMDRWEIAEGMELSVTVNVINTIFLSVLVMPTLVKSAKLHQNDPRLVFVGSALGFVAKKDLAKCGRTNIFQGLNDPKGANMDQRYVFQSSRASDVMLILFGIGTLSRNSSRCMPFVNSRLSVQWSAPA